MLTTLPRPTGISFRALFLILAFLALAQTHMFADTLRVAAYNSLDFRGSQDAAREPYFRTIIGAMNADVVTMEEIESQAAIDAMLATVYQPNDTAWHAPSFMPGPDTGNALFYRSDKVRFISQRAIQTELRDIQEYIIEPLGFDSTQRIHLFVAHLKASSGSDNEAQRQREATTLRAVLDSLPENTLFTMQGDFNFYSSSESGYQVLLSADPSPIGQLYDPINMPGSWNNNGTFAAIHTQSTRTGNLGDGGATGGLDDRFDFILVSAALMDTTGSHVIPQSYHPFGNDGQHFNQSINDGHNLVVPDSVAEALLHASDHLPCVTDFYIGQTEAATPEHSKPSGFQVLACYPNPFNSMLTIEVPMLNTSATLSIFNVLGREIYAQPLAPEMSGKVLHKDFSEFASGYYFVRLQTSTTATVQRVQYIR